MQILHFSLSAVFAFWRGCKFCNLPKMKKLHSGSLSAIFAHLVNADSARLKSANFARDSINYLIKNTNTTKDHSSYPLYL
jgi:hypothetical protein